MQNLGAEFNDFLEVWHKLPREKHPVLPAKSTCSPAVLGNLLAHIGIGRYNAPGDMHVLFYGSEIEQASSLAATGKNYFDLISKKFHAQMKAFHHTLFSTPCGAFIADTVATKNSKYIYESLQLPLTDDSGTPKYLLVYGVGLKARGDDSMRDSSAVNQNNIHTMRYIDLGAGAPSMQIKEYDFYNE